MSSSPPGKTSFQKRGGSLRAPHPAILGQAVTRRSTPSCLSRESRHYRGQGAISPIWLVVCHVPRLLIGHDQKQGASLRQRPNNQEKCAARISLEPQWRRSTLAHTATDDGIFDPTVSMSAPGTPISMLVRDASRCLWTRRREQKITTLRWGARGRWGMRLARHISGNQSLVTVGSKIPSSVGMAAL